MGKIKFKFIKPPWINYNSMEKGKENIRAIMSVDVHPSGSKLATGGQQETGGLVVIWNMAPVRSVEVFDDEKIPKMLFHSAKHQACVNCVRWSPKGTYLASAGDDRVIILWTLTSGSYGESGQTFKGEKNHENWRCTHFLRGHTGDIQDLSWHPSGNWLASASVDNLVLIWRCPPLGVNQGNSHLLIHRITGHNSMVKAVCWDPVGRYLATLGDEPTFRVWRIQEALHSSQSLPTQEICLKGKPFHTGNALLLRLSWSPDGSLVVVPQTVNNGFPTAQLVSRSGWKMDLDFVGHRQTVTCARYNPCVFQLDGHSTNKRVLCLALAGKDRSISVWRTDRMRPWLVINQVFTQAILDVVWSPDGCELVACSLDGTVAIIQFDKNAMGRALSNQELMELHNANYGQSAFQSSSCVSNVGMGSLSSIHQSTDVFNTPLIPEDPEIVNLQRQTEALLAKESQEQLFCQPKKPSPTSVLANRPTKQIEKRTKDGKRRITPAFLSSFNEPLVDANLLPLDQAKSNDLLNKATNQQLTDGGGGGEHPMDSTKQSQATDNNCKSDLLSKDNQSHTVAAITNTTTTTAAAAAAVAPATSLSGGADNKVESVSLNLSVPKATSDVAMKQQNNNNAIKIQTKLPPAKKRRLMNDMATNSAPTKVTGAAATVKEGKSNTTPVKKTAAAGGGVSNKLASVALDNNNTSSSIVGDTQTTATQDSVGTKTENSSNSSGIGSFPLLALSPLVPSANNSIFRCSSSGICVRLQSVPNSTNQHEIVATYSSSNAVSTTATTTNAPVLWNFLCPHRLVKIVLLNQRLYLADESGRLHVFSIQGDRLKLPFPLGAPLSYMSVLDKTLYTINRAAVLMIWSLDPMKQLHRVNLVDILPSNNIRVKSISLAHNGAKPNEILLVWSSGSAYLWDEACNSWVEVCNAEDPIIQKCRQAYFAGASPQGPVHLAQMQAVARSLNLQRFALNNPLLSLNEAHNGGGGTTNAANNGGAFSRSLSSQNVHDLLVSDMFQSQLLAAEAFHSPDEYKHWLKTWIRKLVCSGDVLRLRRICNDLLGPTHHSSQTAWQPDIMNLSKRALLKDILPLFGLNLKLQRLYLEIKDQVDCL